MIPRDKLDEMFALMREEAPFDVDGELLWGYFFTDADKKKLRPLLDELLASGYQEVGLYRTDDRQTYFLHVERVEKHTPISLDARNHELQQLAERHGIESYDGMDVGPVEEHGD
jgi:hypothetical protein